MPSLISGLAGSSWSMSSGLAASSQISNSDVVPTELQVVPKSLGPTAGKFRRSINGLTLDSTGAPLGACDVHCFRTANDTEVDQQPSDASGLYDISVYDDGPFYCKAENPTTHVAGVTDNILVGV